MRVSVKATLLTARECMSIIASALPDFLSVGIGLSFARFMECGGT